MVTVVTGRFESVRVFRRESLLILAIETFASSLVLSFPFLALTPPIPDHNGTVPTPGRRATPSTTCPVGGSSGEARLTHLDPDRAEGSDIDDVVSLAALAAATRPEIVAMRASDAEAGTATCELWLPIEPR